MGCACDLATPKDAKRKGKEPESKPIQDRLSFPSEKRFKPDVIKGPVKQTDGLFYDRNTDSYFLKRSNYDEYGRHGQPVFDFKRSTHNRRKEGKIDHGEGPSRPRMVKPIEPKNNLWHKNVHPKDERVKRQFRQEPLTRTQFRRAQRLHAQKLKAEQANKLTPTQKVPSMVVKPVSNPRVSLKDLQAKTEKLNIEKKELLKKLDDQIRGKEISEDYEDMDDESDEIRFGTMPKVGINMAFTLPMEFKASTHYSDDDSYSSGNLSDSYSEETDDSLLSLDIKDSTNIANANIVPFGKPTKEMTLQVKPLYVKAKFDGKPIGRVLVDNGAAINIIPATTMRKLGKTVSDLYEPIVSLSNFAGGLEKPLGMLPIEVNIGSAKRQTGFYVVETSSVGYNALLGRDWIHSNYCIRSSLHQALILWDDDKFTTIKADSQPFDGRINFAESA